MLTNDDINKLLSVVATKQDIENLATSEELGKFRNDVLDKMDEVYGEVKAMREEQIKFILF